MLNVTKYETLHAVILFKSYWQVIEAGPTQNTFTRFKNRLFMGPNGARCTALAMDLISIMDEKEGSV